MCRTLRSVAFAKTDFEGRFDLKFLKAMGSCSEGWQPVNVVAISHSGALGPDWQKPDANKPGVEITLRLPADEPIEGRIVDLEGRPIVDAIVELISLTKNAKGDITSWLDAMRRGVPENGIDEASDSPNQGIYGLSPIAGRRRPTQRGGSVW